MMRKPKPSWPFFSAAWLSVCGVLLTGHAPAQPLGPLQPRVDGWIGLPMYQDPLIEPVPTRVILDPAALALWIEALRGEIASDRRQAAEAIRRASSDGLDGFGAAVPVLTQVVREDPVPRVRAAAAAALDTLDDPAAAEALAAVIDGNDPDIVLTADRALIRWRHQPATAAWMTRLTDADEPLALRLSAIEALGALTHTPAAEPLAAMVPDDGLPFALRLAAARGLGQIQQEGLGTLARPLAQSTSARERLLAVYLLTHHPEWPRTDWMLALAQDADAAVSATALQSLNRRPESAATIREMESRLTLDGRPNVRLQVAIARGRAVPDEAAPLLAEMLDDPSVAVRSFARDRLIEVAGETGGHAPVAGAVLRVLENPAGWRAAEQAALVAGRIDLDASAPALIVLMTHDRPEVRLASTDALCRIEVQAVLPRMLERAEQLTQRVSSFDAEAAPASRQSANHELTQLFQAFGRMGYTDAVPLLKRYVAKSTTFGSAARGAAVYALGKILEGQNDDNLAGQLRGRLADVAGMEPESQEVRHFAAITLGRLKAQNQLNALRKFAEEEADGEIGEACRWAIGQITGSLPPAPEARSSYSRGYFLEPAETSKP